MENKKFYTCKNDIAFKEVFMEEKNKDILIALLESILDIKILELTYLNNEKNNGNVFFKRKHFDLQVKTDKEYIQIEVNAPMKNYTRYRNASYLFNTYSNVTLKGENYNGNITLIQLNFNYDLSEKYYGDLDDVINRYVFSNQKGKTYVDNLILYEFNMDYFTKLWYSKDEKEKDKFKYLMMMNLDLNQLKNLSKEDKVVKKYMEEIDRVNKDPEFYEYMSAEEDDRKIINSLKEEYKEECKEEGRKEGRIEGIREGKQEGLKEGKLETNRDNAYKMLQENIDIDIISRVTGLSKEEILKIEYHE